ncbi:MAG: DNA polymerase III subunit gamma/tau [Eubacteriales bacterium]|nr:DNA polymerase III subunit gamma/tau [Eubacteriales bacterium]
MSQLALYRAWRPQTFDEVVAQKQVVYPLKQAVISGDIGHAYLFSGTRGTGKTSLAKIFAKAVNCLDPHNGNPCNQCKICQGINDASLLDVMEIDAASHNSVDNIRRITDEVVFMPTEAKYKVYIIDEVHMLSQGAFNALLKTLEEPPPHVIFILATTEPQRIPATILSRCQRFEFRRIPLEAIEERLREIAAADGIKLTPEAIHTIARLGDGALRDAISLLDQCSSGIEGEITQDDVLTIAGVVRDDFLVGFCSQVLTADLAGVLTSLDELQMSGRSLQRFLQDFLAYLRDLLVASLPRIDADQLINQTSSGIDALRELARLTSQDQLMAMISRLSKINNEMRWSQDPKTTLELAFISEVTQIAPAQAMSASSTVSQAEAKPTVINPEAQSATVEAEPVAAVPVPKPTNASQAVETPTTNPPAVDSQTDAKNTARKGSRQSMPAVSDSQAVEGEHEAAATAPQTQADTTSETASDAASPVWEAILDQLRELGRYDMVMLIKPAEIKINGNEIQAIYGKDYKAHFETMSRSENVEILAQAANRAGISAPKVSFELEKNDTEAEQKQEPLWVQKLRQASKVHGLEFELPDPPEENN